MSHDWQPLLLTFRLAAITTLILFVIGIPLAYWVAFTRTRIKPVIETLVSMPLVLPPSVLGFYLLLAFSPQNAFGQWLEQWFHIRLVFSFAGLVVGSVIFSLPFMVHPIQSGFQNLPMSLVEASRTLGKSWCETSRSLPWLLRAFSVAFRRSWFGLSRPVNGSSSKSTCASCASARARKARCC